MELVLSSEELQVLNFLIAFAIPALVAVITKRFASSTLKASLLVVLSALTAVLTEMVDSGSFVFLSAILLFFQNIAVAVTAHVGVLKPAGVTGSQGVIAKNTEPLGLLGNNPNSD